ncbi:hypothetical protein DCAR_0207837 [Daucus carota subsp. sativus]|uniref:ferric-chelate reductase (NADH) n=1 Tax=Daucus carota subsp. sativus TaxID=79200 RepID=A0AAF0WFI5_DAUCS|nr:hypothetical protein DCAR_0207837 [Daucus carota subsp. sativus]
MDRKVAAKMMRAVILTILMVVISGHMLIWMMMPTNVYKSTWLPRIRAASSSTYFGLQGSTLLVNTFPVLFAAVLACFYLHLANTFPNQGYSSKTRGMSAWRRRVIVKGLGIVSLTELSFLIIFLALLLWSFSTYLHVGFGKITHKSAAKEGEKMWEAKLESAAKRLGFMGNLCVAFLFYPVTRGSSLLPVFGLTSESSVKYHIWVGHITMTFLSAHGVCYILFWALTNQLSEMLKWAKVGVANAAGELALLSGLLMWLTTFPRIRRKFFELFFYTHYLYIPFIFFFVIHVGISYACIMLPSFYLFIIDRYLRFLQSRQGVRLVSARVLPCLSYTPTSIMFLNVPSISKMQWHPFTISSSSSLEPETLSVIIKGEGSWSRKLFQTLSSPSSLDRLHVSIEGPYGPASTSFSRHDELVMVSGGSGITPFISIFRELVYLCETLKCKTPKILLISSFKNSSDLTMLDLLLPISSTPSELSKLNLQIEAYITRETQSITTQNSEKLPSYNVWFKPNLSNTAITPVLGQNSWLWLAAIISSSFIVFLIAMGTLTRFYIYPIDHNTNKLYPYSSRAVLNMLLISLSIAMTASGAFLWNKRNCDITERKQVQNMEGTPDSGSYTTDRELESLPQQWLAQSTSLHYGERPDLKRYLFERKEASVGVLVCGPKKMRHEVADICSSGLAQNLHFESISFSW